MPHRPNLSYSAPVLSVDLAGASGEIWPCTDCLPWHLEVVTDDDRDPCVREWHAADCPTLRELLDNQEGTD